MLNSCVADCINREYQSRSGDESADVLACLARRLAAYIEDEEGRAAFLNIASMSGLEIAGDHLRQPPAG